METTTQASQLVQALIVARNEFAELADKMDDWAEQSRTGGWSTHQVDANRREADHARRAAARIDRVVARATEAEHAD